MVKFPRICYVQEMSPEFFQAMVDLTKNLEFNKGQILFSNREVFFTTMMMMNATPELMNKIINEN